MSNAGYFGKSKIQISGEEYQLCRPTLFLTGLLLYVNKEPTPKKPRMSHTTCPGNSALMKMQKVWAVKVHECPKATI